MGAQPEILNKSISYTPIKTVQNFVKNRICKNIKFPHGGSTSLILNAPLTTFLPDIILKNYI